MKRGGPVVRPWGPWNTHSKDMRTERRVHILHVGAPRVEALSHDRATVDVWERARSPSALPHEHPERARRFSQNWA